MKNIYKLSWLFIAFFAFIACSDDNEPIVPNPEPPVAGLKEGLNYSPEVLDADKELKITFKAPKSSALYGYTGDVYLHTGIVSEGTWMYVPAEWDQNLAKCKMTRDDDNTWSIKLAPSIRQWFGSGDTPVQKLGLVIRSSDGSKKGIGGDSFVEVTDTKYEAFVPAAIKNAPLPSGVVEGINVIDNSTVTLVLYDKDTKGSHKDFAHVTGDFNNWKLSNGDDSQMFRDDASGCWWITLTGLNAAKEYAFQYYVGMKGGETIRLADAYSRKILDPDNDKYIDSSTYPENKEYPVGGIGIVSVFKIQKDAYNWKVKNFVAPGKDELMIYELLVRDFTSSGNVQGVMSKLDYIRSLGFNAVELMPVQEFDGNDSWGYNPCFFFALDKAYGTDKMYKELIDACHEKGLAVIFDVVYNHASGSNPFAKLYWDSAKNKTSANNPWFNVDAPHPFSVFHDFNHESPLVKAFVKRNLKFLLEEYNIDGFRFDLTKGFTQTKSTESTSGNYDAARIAILKGYNDAVKTVRPDAYVIFEHLCGLQEEAELGKEGIMLWRNMNTAYSQTAMGWPEDSSKPSDFTGTYYGTSMPANSLVSYMESHDEERTANTQIKWGNGVLKTDLASRMKQLETNASFFFTVPGPKMIWQFGEMGYDISIDEGGRTGRKPIHWEYLDNADRKGLHDTYAQLLKLRDDNPELFDAKSTLVWKVKMSNWVDGRFITLEAVNGKKLVVVGNFTNGAINASTVFPATGEWTDYMNGGKLNVTSTTHTIPVPANEFRLYINF